MTSVDSHSQHRRFTDGTGFWTVRDAYLPDIRTFRRCLLLLISTVSLAACAPNRPYRTAAPVLDDCVATVSQDCPQHTLFKRVSDDYPGIEVPVGIVEFDDMGILMNREHKDGLMDVIRAMAAEQDIMLVVFAHGWRHNAASKNSNLRDFQDFLLKVSDTEHRRCRTGQCESRQVFGIYLGWRGLSATLPGFKLLSFWNRKERAQRVGQDGATEILSELRRIQKPDRKDTSVPNRADSDHRLILIGHSFGGALLYNATQQILQHSASFLFSNDVPRNIADIIILVNPAFEAARMSALHERSLTKQYDKSQRTVLAIFTSESDRATSVAFPLGRHLSTLFNDYREGSEKEQKELDVRAIGHHVPYLTHELLVADADATDKGYRAAVCDWYAFKDGEKDIWDLQNGVELKRADWIANDALRNTPFFNVRVTDDLVDGHNRIWGDRFRDVLYRLIAVQDSPRC